MSCFWDTLINKIKDEDLKGILNHSNPNPSKFAELLKEKNKETENILWNNNELTDEQCNENFTHVKDYNISVCIITYQ